MSEENLDNTVLPDELDDVESPLPFEDFSVINLREDDLNEEFNELDGFREWERDNHSSEIGLNFGDY